MLISGAEGNLNAMLVKTTIKRLRAKQMQLIFRYLFLPFITDTSTF